MSESTEPKLPTNSELAQQRTNLAGTRTDLAGTRTELAQVRTELAEVRNELARKRTGMAAERTMLAWIRTSLSLISFGFGIDRFFKYLDKTEGDTAIDAIGEERIIGLTLIALGVFALAAAIVGHSRTLSNLERDKNYRYIPEGSLSVTVAVVLLFVGLAAFFPLILSGVSFSEIFRLDSIVFQNFAKIAVFLTVLVLGIDLPRGELRAFWSMPGLLLRSLLSVVILPPAIVIALLTQVDLPKTLALALVILVACPGPPLLSRRSGMAGARASYVGSLQVTLAILTAFVVPVVFIIADRVLFPGGVSVNVLTVLEQVAFVQFLPLGLGIAIRAIAPEMVQEIGEFLRQVSNTVFVVFAVLVLFASPQVLGSLDRQAIVLGIGLTAIGLLVGHVLGGPEDDIRAGLATATIARNAGLALAICAINGYPQVIPPLAGFVLIGIISALPYNLIMKRKIAAQSAA